MADSFEDFLKRREAVSDAYIRGDASALAAMLTTERPATFFSPRGDMIEEPGPVRDAQVAGAAAFGPASTGHFEILSSGSSGSLAFWTGRQVATMDIQGQDEPVPMVLRTTEVFRLEEGTWRLIHRHADTVQNDS